MYSKLIQKLKYNSKLIHKLKYLPTLINQKYLSKMTLKFSCIRCFLGRQHEL